MNFTGNVEDLLREEASKLHDYILKTWGDYDPGYKKDNPAWVIWVIQSAYSHLTNSVRFRDETDQRYFELLGRLREKRATLEKELAEYERVRSDSSSDLDQAREAIAKSGELEEMIEFLNRCIEARDE